MNKASYSNNISKLATVNQAKERYKLSRNLLMQIAEDNGAVRRIGRAVRIDIPEMDKATEKYNKEAKERGLEQIGEFCPHMARHTYTSLAYSAGADVKIVSQILGHASTAITMDTYTHLTNEKRRQQEKVAQTIKIS